MYEAVCPACGTDIKFIENFQVGQNAVCPSCSELLAVVMTEPLIFDLYTFTNPTPEWFDSEKQEAAKKHERKVKHRHDEIEEHEDEDYYRKKSGKKSRNKSRFDW